MNLNDIINEGAEKIDESKIVWARKGNTLSRKHRCVSGPRAGRVVSDPTQCFAPVNLKKRMVLRKTKSSKGGRMARKAKRTKRINTASKRLRRLNK